MQTLTSPGIYLQQRQPQQVTGALLRSDIAAFIGFSRKGPLARPQRLNSWQQFNTLFGAPLESGYLALSVKAFFENGGQSCYVYRLADSQAQSASLVLHDASGAASLQCSAVVRLSDLADTADTVQRQTVLRQSVADPGSWGNSLNLTLARSSRLSTRVSGYYNDGYATYLDSLVGLEPFSIVELSQQDSSGLLVYKASVAIDSIDTLRQSVTWQRNLLTDLHFNPALPLHLDTVEYDLTLEYEQRQVERFNWLGLHPQHSRSLLRFLSQQSQYIDITTLSSADPYLRDNWPQPVSRQRLSGGQDGLTQLTVQHYLQALQQLSALDDIAIVAAPDLVLHSTVAPALANIYAAPLPACATLSAPFSGQIRGYISDGAAALAAVSVIDAETGRHASSNSSGDFVLANLPLGLRTLRLEKAGYRSQERQIQSGQQPTDTEQFVLQPLLLPGQFSDIEILQVQLAMSNPFQLGRYRMALLDPPRPDMALDDIRQWRSQLGDSSVAILCYPWLDVADSTSSNIVTLPPSGYIAGALAHAEQQQGPELGPANVRLRFAKAVSRSLNDTEHGILNAAGINLLRAQPGQGIRLLGSRTLSDDSAWRYINVRRLVFALEKTLERALQWAVFEPNGTVLRQAILLSVTTLLQMLWRRGALAGQTADAAFLLKCDADNNPPALQSEGKLLLEIAIAPAVPFEFIYIRFGKTLDAIEVTE